MTMDFAALPPEVNSAAIYAGNGAASLLGAAAAWNALAQDLRSAAVGYGSAITNLADAGWQGPSAAAMATAAAPYVTWMHSTAEQAEQAGMQAAAAAAAYEAAFAATVPPTVIAANRALLAELVSTNALGVNTPAIATTEAHYGQMWAQDAAAMYTYEAASTSASALAPMAPAPATTSLTGLSGLVSQAVAAGQAAISNVEGAVQEVVDQLGAGLSALPSTLLDSFESGISNVVGLLGSLGQGLCGVSPGTSGGGATLTHAPGVPRLPMPEPPRVPMTPRVPTAPSRAVMAEVPVRAQALTPMSAVGQATSVGRMSVPASWGTANPAAVAVPAAMEPGAAAMAAPAAAPMLARGVPAGASIPASTVAGMERAYGGGLDRISVLPRLVG